MSTTVTIDRVEYTIEKLENGNIRVTHAAGQLHPMQGPDTDGVRSFEVHPCQVNWYGYWNERLPPDEQASEASGSDDPAPWWSSKSWKKKFRPES